MRMAGCGYDPAAFSLEPGVRAVDVSRAKHKHGHFFVVKDLISAGATEVMDIFGDGFIKHSDRNSADGRRFPCIGLSLERSISEVSCC